MTQFVQFHVLKTHAPSNLNRDDLGRPKTARYGGVQRLRISSQCLKRALRTSDIFSSEFGPGRLGHLTRELGVHTYERFKDDYDQELLLKAVKFANLVLENGVNNIGTGTGDSWKLKKSPQGKVDKVVKAFEKEGTSALHTGQAMRLHDFQVRGYEKAVKYMCQEGLPSTEEEKDLIEHYIHVSEEPSHAVDIALFGRMMTSNPSLSMDGSSMVSHAISVDEVETETDYFTAVDDFTTGTGAAHSGEKDFASATLYIWAAVDVDRLVENLEGDTDTAAKVVKAFGKALAMVNPSGNQTTFASQSLADYMQVDVSETHPCALHTAFETPVESNDQGIMPQAIERLKTTAQQYADTYGNNLPIQSESFSRFDDSKLDDVLAFVDNAFDQ